MINKYIKNNLSIFSIVTVLKLYSFHFSFFPSPAAIMQARSRRSRGERRDYSLTQLAQNKESNKFFAAAGVASALNQY